MKNAKFSGDHVFGITCEAPRYYSLKIGIENSTFIMNLERSAAAISVERPILAGSDSESGIYPSCIIDNNTIKLKEEAFKCAGISVTTPFLAMGPARITRNIVENTSPKATQEAIFIQTGEGARVLVEDNTVRFDNDRWFRPYKRHGIAVVDAIPNGVGHIVRNNTVEEIDQGIGTYRSWCALHIQNLGNTGTLVCNNHLDGQRRGLHFEGENDKLNIHSNQISGAQDGYYIAGNMGATGQQVRTDNRWIENSNEYNRMANNQSSLRSDFSNVVVHSTAPDVLPSSIEQNDNINWFSVESGGTADCPEYPIIKFGNGGTGTSAFDAIVTDFVSSDQNSDIDQLYAQYGLYNYLLHNPSEITGNTAIQSFYTTESNQFIGKLAYEVYTARENVESLILNGNGSLANGFNQILSNVESVVTAPDQSTATVVGQVLMNSYGALDQLRTAYFNSSLSVLNNSLIGLNSIATSNSAQKALKSYVLIGLKESINTTVSSTEVDNILNVNYDSKDIDLARFYGWGLSLCDREIYVGDYGHEDDGSLQQLLENKESIEGDLMKLQYSTESAMNVELLKDLRELTVFDPQGTLLWHSDDREVLSMASYIDIVLQLNVTHPVVYVQCITDSEMKIYSIFLNK